MCQMVSQPYNKRKPSHQAQRELYPGIVSGQCNPSNIFTKEMCDGVNFRCLQDSFMSWGSSFLKEIYNSLHPLSTQPLEHCFKLPPRLQSMSHLINQGCLRFTISLFVPYTGHNFLFIACWLLWAILWGVLMYDTPTGYLAPTLAT